MKTDEQNSKESERVRKGLPRVRVIKNTSEVSKSSGGRGFIMQPLATARDCR